jgi:CHAT domain-containing protein/pimeloyl-ACP methyl ester carboxylesterase
MPVQKKKRKTAAAKQKKGRRARWKPAELKQSAFGQPSNALEHALLTGESRGLLEDYFGPENYEQLRDLSRDAATRSVRGGPRVLILPGIMGSTLGKKTVFNLEDILWLDPAEIALGHLTSLKLDGTTSPFHSVGVILFTYLKLKLRLKIAGFDADFFAYDWRRSLAQLGTTLADVVNKNASNVMLVAHSMGGLVARAALPGAGDKIKRLVMVGTPNYGSFAPVQVFRGTYDVVQKVAALDLRHNAAQLSDVFNTFPGLYEMLPSPEKFTAVDLYDAASWPQKGPQPRSHLLSTVKHVLDKLAPADSRFFLIAGVNQDTVTGLQMNGGEFAYEVSPDGDGTVPIDFARLANIPEGQTYYVQEGHGSLPNNGTVEAAVIDIFSKASTAALPTQRPPANRGRRVVSEEELREMAKRAPRPGQLGSADYRHLLDAVAAPPRPDQATVGVALPSFPGAGDLTVADQQFHQLIIGRRRQRRLEMTLARGSITDIDAAAYVLGVFRNVAPGGAAKAIDQYLDGAITDFTERRMLTGEMGSVFVVPVGRNQLPADIILFAGLGSFDRFNADVQQLVAENVSRVLARSRIDEFATVLIGAGSGLSISTALKNLLTGFLRGLSDADSRHRFRSITLCESDVTRFTEMKNELYDLAGTALFADVELVLDEIEIPPSVMPPARFLPQAQEPIYVIVGEEGQADGQLHYRVSILGSGMKAAVVSASKGIAETRLRRLLGKFDKAVAGPSTSKDLQSFGRQFSELVLPSDVCTVLTSMKDRHLVIVHDDSAASIPWETLAIGTWTPAVEGGISRRYLADHLPLANWLEERRVEPTLRLLLVVNPLSDLAGADAEADRIVHLSGTTSGIEITQLRREEASKAAILSALRAGKYDCIHYAGHAFFSPSEPRRSGLICAGQQILSGADLVGLRNLPFMIFFNACEAGRIRGRQSTARQSPILRLRESAGVAEALMRGGVANYLSTYWPVGDKAAESFAATFYKEVLGGNTVGEAVLAGRKAVLSTGDRDWADYILYGNFDFVLKQPETRGAL